MKNKLNIVFVTMVVLFSITTYADDSSASSDFQFYPEVKTVVPVFLGFGAGMSYQDHFEIDFAYGLTPKPYYQTIGSVAATLSGNSAYKDVIESAFQNNSLWRIGMKYNFTSSKKGWSLGLAFSRLKSSGKAGIDKVLQAATGQDYTTLKNLLTSAGRSTEVDMDGTLTIGEIQAGYTWELNPHLSLAAALGVGKVLNSDIHLKTGLTAFESTPAGNSLMRSSEDDLESIIDEYGISPTLGINLNYVF